MKIKRGPRNPPAEEEKESERRLEELSYEEMLRESLNKQGSEESHLDVSVKGRRLLRVFADCCGCLDYPSCCSIYLFLAGRVFWTGIPHFHALTSKILHS
jgi:hypothetical protein